MYIVHRCCCVFKVAHCTCIVVDYAWLNVRATFFMHKIHVAQNNKLYAELYLKDF